MLFAVGVHQVKDHVAEHDGGDGLRQKMLAQLES
jgi:hypothetical protein